MAQLISIAYKIESKGVMTEVSEASVSLEAGVENDRLGRPGKRQVTVMSLEQWNQATSELAPTPPTPFVWTDRRCNILVSGIAFSAKDVGSRLKIGSLILEITGETDPCKKMRAVHPGLEQALTPNWRGGVTCRVIQPATIKAGDRVTTCTDTSSNA